MANHWFGLCKSCATITLPVWSACNDSTESSADARAPSCFKVRKSSRRVGSRRHGLSFPDREPVNCPGCAVKAALQANSEKARTELWITGSNDNSFQAGLQPPLQRARQHGL